jgi:AraC-like DNA-binding protein
MDIVLYYSGSRKEEEEGFLISRPEGNPRYLFLHFISSLEGINTAEGYVSANPGACILYSPSFPQKFTSGPVRFAHDWVDFVQKDDTFFTKIKLPLNTLFYPGMSKEISLAIQTIGQLKDSDEVGGEFKISNTLESLFIELSQKIHRHALGSKKAYGEKIHVSFEDARIEIYEHPENKNVTSLASEMGFSRAYFTATWRKYFKLSPGEDIRKAKYAKAQELLAHNEKGTAVASFLGFKTPEYFYRFMKKMAEQDSI